jgi:DtxR family Mn-dependent transcriptional regulator
MAAERRMNSQAVEDYAKAIFSLQARNGGEVGTSALAEHLGVSPGSASAMVKRLAEMKLVRHEPYKGVVLTAAGKKVALEVMRHHRLIELYLSDALGMPWDRVHREAEVLEHYISEDLEELISSKLGNPTHDPHGDPIPTRELNLEEDRTLSLFEMEAGQEGTLARVSDSDGEMLRYLAEREIYPGASIVVEGRQPFGGPIEAEIAGKKHVLGGALASCMRVALDEPAG